MSEVRVAPVEWPTLALLGATYALWLLAISWAAAFWLPLGVCLLAVAGAQHSSLCHEALHGHPTRIKWLNEALVFPQLTLVIPYGRFRDTHLAHHIDERLTDPYDDPETNFHDPAVWYELPRRMKVLLNFNNTLLGRMAIGPLLGQVFFMRSDWRAIRRGEAGVLAAWLLHIPAAGCVIWGYQQWGQMPLWAFLLGSYLGLSLLKIRTYLEHRAHESSCGRSVVVEDRGVLALLFLNNNYHALHHARPGVPWYQLPRLFRAERAAILKRNDGYYYRSYREVFAKHLVKAKDPVPHPLWPKS